MNLRKLSDFDLVSKLAECIDSLEGNNLEFWLDIEEQVSYGHKISNRQREKMVKMIEQFHPDHHSENC